MEWPFLIVN